MTNPSPDIEKLLANEHARKAPQRKLPPYEALKREFQVIGEDRYRLVAEDIGITIEVDRLRREHHELIGELAVWCTLPGAHTVVDGSLSIADFNFSSSRARTERAKLLSIRANAGDLDWQSLVEEFCQRVLRADRAGQPAVDLRSIARPNAADDLIRIAGMSIPRRHATILFGDGGAAKSYLALWLAGKLAEMGIPVAYFDWELAADEHRDRLERLFPEYMPKILYARCERALVHEADRLRRIVRDNGIQFCIFDSIVFACDGPPESAETAGRYFRAVRQITGGSLHVAHITKGENADKKPFGSTFWHNGARSTWFAKRDEGTLDESTVQVGLFNRKSNLGKINPALGFRITFSDELTSVERCNIGDSPDLAGQLSTRQRMALLLRKGALDPAHIAEEVDADIETVKRTVRRHKEHFVVLEGGRIGLVDRRTS